MREIRQSGSEGGVADNGHPYPYQGEDGCGSGRPLAEGAGREACGSGRDGVSPSTPWAAGRGGDSPRDSFPTGEAFGLHPWVLPPTQPHLSTSEVRRFLRKSQAGSDGPLGDPSLPGERVRTAFGGVPLP